MANTKTLNTRIIQKHDIEANWKKATNFTPMKGEVIIYDAGLIEDGKPEVVDYIRIKIGDGETLVSDLPFFGGQIDFKAPDEIPEGYIVPEGTIMLIPNTVTVESVEEDGVTPVMITQTFYSAKAGAGLPIEETTYIANLRAGDGWGSVVQVEATTEGDMNDDGTKYINPIATGARSVALGKYTTAEGNNSVVINYNNIATKNGEHGFAAGQANTVNAIGSFAAGHRNTNNGAHSAVFGGANTNNATHGFILGKYNNLGEDAEGTFITGAYNTSNTPNQIVGGKYNVESPNGILVLGNGTNNLNRKNAFVVNNNGTIEIDGKPMTATPSIKVEVPEGTKVICSNNEVELSGNAEGGYLIFYNIPYGIWNISAIIDDEDYNVNVTINSSDVSTVTFNQISEVFSENSLDTVIYACANNKIPATWNVGDEIPFVFDGVEYHLVIIGKNVDTLNNGELAPLTFQFKEVLQQKVQHKPESEKFTNYNWENSLIRTMTIPDLLSKLQCTFRNCIVSTTQETTLINGSIQTTEDSIFIPAIEDLRVDGKYYDYYSVSENRIKNAPDTENALVWYTRSPYNDSKDTRYYTINAEGAEAFSAKLMFISPTFCLGKPNNSNSSEDIDLSGYVTTEMLAQAISGAGAAVVCNFVGQETDDTAAWNAAAQELEETGKKILILQGAVGCIDIDTNIELNEKTIIAYNSGLTTLNYTYAPTFIRFNNCTILGGKYYVRLGGVSFTDSKIYSIEIESGSDEYNGDTYIEGNTEIFNSKSVSALWLKNNTNTYIYNSYFDDLIIGGQASSITSNITIKNNTINNLYFNQYQNNEFTIDQLFLEQNHILAFGTQCNCSINKFIAINNISTNAFQNSKTGQMQETHKENGQICTVNFNEVTLVHNMDTNKILYDVKPQSGSQEIIETYLYADRWTPEGYYSFTNFETTPDEYNSTKVDLEVSLEGSICTADQKKAYDKAELVGTNDNNIRAFGEVPIIDIPILLKVVYK